VKKNPISKLKQGFLYPFRAFRFIKRHPRLYKYILIPFTINLSVFSLTIYYGLGFFFDLVSKYIPQGDAWYWFLLNYLLMAIAILVSLVLVFFTFTVIGSLIASPFNDILSERTEELLTGQTMDEPFVLKTFLEDSGRVLVTESKKISLFLAGMLLLLFLNILPIIGSLLYSVLSVTWTVFFLVIEYTGYVFSRKKLVFKEQRHIIYQDFSLMAGFGLGVFCILAIPFLQFLCIPLGVVGATCLLYDTSAIKSETPEN
jgi:CysZ protein